jgi:hypothetical protein
MAVGMNEARRMAELEANARYTRDRHRLYRARVHGPGATSPDRLRDLHREAELAERLLAHARAGDS